MDKVYRKALDPKYGCPKCGNFIPSIVNGGFKCRWCGHTVKAERKKVSGCLCWVGGGLCPVHGGRSGE